MIPQQAMMKDALLPHTPSPLPADADATVTGTDIVYLADLQPGRDPFTGEKLKPATVLYASAEHAASQVIQPRFVGLHGDPARLVILRRAVSARSMSSPDSALRDLHDALEDALQKTHAHLVILDPWDGLWDVDLDRASQTRPLLDRLARLAELHRCCILLIRHLAARPTGAGLPKRKFAAQWLRDCLQPGSQTQGSIEIVAERDGVCIATLRRAKFDIGVRRSKDGKSGAWWWTLPHPEDEYPPVNEARCSN